MNTGTRIRTALAVALALYTAFLKTDVTEFGNDIVNLIYQILMKLVTFAVIFLITYYNNDYTPESCIGTGVTRQLKAEKHKDYIGEHFTHVDENDPSDEDEEALEDMDNE